MSKGNDFKTIAKERIQNHMSIIQEKASDGAETPEGIFSKSIAAVKSFMNLGENSPEKTQEKPIDIPQRLAKKQRVDCKKLLNRLKAPESYDGPDAQELISKASRGYRFYRHSFDTKVPRDDFDELLSDLGNEASEREEGRVSIKQRG